MKSVPNPPQSAFNKSRPYSVIGVKRPRRPQFTHVCYSIIAVLVDDPNTIFPLTNQRIAERMVKSGWLTKRKIKLPQKVGVYEFEAEFVNFVPTEEGLRRYTELSVLVKGVDSQQLQCAIKGEREKEILLRNVNKVKEKMRQ